MAKIKFFGDFMKGIEKDFKNLDAERAERKRREAEMAKLNSSVKEDAPAPVKEEEDVVELPTFLPRSFTPTYKEASTVAVENPYDFIVGEPKEISEDEKIDCNAWLFGR